MLTSWWKPALLAAWIALLICLEPKVAHAQDASGHAVTGMADASRAVVRIESLGAFVPFAEFDSVLEESTGTGFIIDPEGIVVTNAHVVNGGEAFHVYLDGEAAPRYATVLGISECSDLAVLDLRGSGYPYLQWADGAPRTGQRVYALGYPGGRFQMSRGAIRKASAIVDTPWASVEDVLYHTAEIAPGSSGGPLLNADGQVVGVNFANESDRNYSVAISWSGALSVVDTLARGTNLDSIGVNGQAFLVEDEDMFGIWVVSVDSDSPAARLGIEPADILLSLEEIPLGIDGNLGTYCTVLRSHPADAIMHMMLVRLSTQEILCGQINGESLFNCDSLVEAEDGSNSTTEIHSGNGIYHPAAEATVQGSLVVQGVAVHPDFWKWQLDLLLNGTRAIYIGGGESPVPAPSDLLVLDTDVFPNGRHVLRLRVVRKDGNYDEFYTAINIQN